MAITIIDGFDLAAVSADLVAKGWYRNETYLEAGEGKFGGQCIRTDANNDILQEWCDYKRYSTVSFWFKSVGALASSWIVGLQGYGIETGGLYGAGAIMGIAYNSAGAIDLHTNAGTSLQKVASSASGVIATGKWHHIEVQTFNDSSGSVKVFVDSAEIITYTGDTNPYDVNNLSVMTFMGTANGHRFDDIVIQRDTVAIPPLIGFHQIHTLRPNADTAQADFVPLSGAGFENIDDPLSAHDSDTTYIQSTAAGNKSLFEIEDLPAPVATVHAVQTTTDIRKEGAEGSSTVSINILSGASEEASGIISLNDAYAPKYTLHLLDPATSAAWGVAAVNSLQVGVEVLT